MTTKYWRCRDKGNLTGDSEWSALTSFETPSVQPIPNYPHGISAEIALWAGDRFVIIESAAPSRTYYSFDGFDWVQGDDASGAGGYTYGVYDEANDVIIVATNSGRSVSVDRGLTWGNALGVNPSSVLRGMSANDTGLSISGGEGTPSGARLDIASDGVTWTGTTTTFLPAGVGSLDWTDANGGFFLGTGSFTSDHSFTSLDGVNWDVYTMPGKSDWLLGGEANGSFFYMPDTFSTDVYSTDDGINWSVTPTANLLRFRDVVSSGARIHAAGIAFDSGSGHVAYSDNAGVSWVTYDISETGLTGGRDSLAFSPTLNKTLSITVDGTVRGWLIA